MTATATPTPVTAVGTPWVTFAGVMTIVAGVANLFWGWSALIQNSLNEAYAPVIGELTVGPLEFWGWVSIAWSLVLFLTSWLLLSHHESGKIVGITVATISAVFWLFALVAFPLWAIAAIAVDCLIIYGLTVHWETAK
ncbi:MAG: hypothetical protein U0R64_10390 [Candidatus Nanopelagicales bacterium]